MSLEEQVRAYARHAEAAVAPVSVDEAVARAARAEATVETPRARRGRLMPALVAAVSAVLVAVAALVLLRVSQAPPEPAVDDLVPDPVGDVGAEEYWPQHDGVIESTAELAVPDWIVVEEDEEGRIRENLVGLEHAAGQYVMCGGDIDGFWYATSEDAASWERVDVPWTVQSPAGFGCPGVWGDTAVSLDPRSETHVLTVRHGSETSTREFADGVGAVAVGGPGALVLAGDAHWLVSEGGSGLHWLRLGDADHRSIVDVIGTEDGYYTVEPTGGSDDPFMVRFSGDGAGWTVLGSVEGHGGTLVRRDGRAVWTGDSGSPSYSLLTPDGVLASAPLPGSRVDRDEAPDAPHRVAIGSAGALVADPAAGRAIQVGLARYGEPGRAVQLGGATVAVSGAAHDGTYLVLTGADEAPQPGRLALWRIESAPGGAVSTPPPVSEPSGGTVDPATREEGVLTSRGGLDIQAMQRAAGGVVQGLEVQGRKYLACGEGGPRGYWYAWSADGAAWQVTDVGGTVVNGLGWDRTGCAGVWGDTAAWAEGEHAVTVLREGEAVSTDFDSQVWIVLVGAPGVVAYTDGGTWFSDDGVDWSPMTGDHGTILQAIGAGDGFYLIDPTRGPSDPLKVLHSPDGQAWDVVGEVSGGWDVLARRGGSAEWTGSPGLFSELAR